MLMKIVVIMPETADSAKSELKSDCVASVNQKTGIATAP